MNGDDELHIEHQGASQRWVVIHTRTGMGVLKMIRSRAAAEREATRMRTLIDWSTLHQVAIPAIEPMPGRELGAFGMKPRPAEQRWRLPPDQVRILLDEQLRVLCGGAAWSADDEHLAGAERYPRLQRRLETMTGAAVHLAKHVDSVRAELEVPDGYDEEDVVLEIRRLLAELAESRAVVEAAEALVDEWYYHPQEGSDAAASNEAMYEALENAVLAVRAHRGGAEG